MLIPQDVAAKLKLVAIQRQEDKRQKNINNKKHCKKVTPLATEIIGLKGEYVFSEWSGLPMDLTLRDGGDEGIDFRKNGMTLDVKTTKTFYLIFDSLRDVKADYYVLVMYQGEEFGMYGWVPKDFVLANYETKDMGYGDRKVIHFTQLRKMEELTFWKSLRTKSRS